MAENPERSKDSDDKKSRPRSKLSLGAKIGIGIAVAGVAGVVAVVAAPVVLAAAGFTTAGIASGSVAASMMSAAAVANGGGVAAGSVVAVLQSIGAAGLTTTSGAILGGSVTAVSSGVISAIVKYTHKPDGKEGTVYRKKHPAHPEISKLLDYATYLMEQREYKKARELLMQAHDAFKQATDRTMTNEEALPLLFVAEDIFVLQVATSDALELDKEVEDKVTTLQELRAQLAILLPQINPHHPPNQHM